MKELADGSTVPARMYYYILDFNDRTSWEYMWTHFGQKKLMNLNRSEFFELFEHATTVDLTLK